MKLLKSPRSLFLAIALAAVIAIALIMTRSPLEHVATGMPVKAVEIIAASEIPFRASVTAYGSVRPAITLNSMAEVSGKISYMHPNLQAGETIPAQTLVVRIDATDYALTLKQTQADLQASRSSLRELDEEEKSTERTLELAQKNLQVGEVEFKRIQDVYEQRLVAKSTLDAQEQKTLQSRQQVEELQGRMNGYDSRRQSIRAQIDRAEQEVQNRETILGRTEITLPFDARIGTVSIETNEFVSVGSLLFEAIDLDGVEITAQLPMESMRRLVSHLEGLPISPEQIFRSGGSMTDSLNLVASVRLVNDMPGAIWEARVLRLSESIDATRQTLGIVVGVDNPYAKVIPGERPPLLKGMYTAVDLYAPVRPAMVIPRKSVHEGRVYIAGDDDMLSIRSVDIQLVQGDLVVIRDGITEGERIIITDLIPVIEGMPLQVTSASEFELELRRNAVGTDQ